VQAMDAGFACRMLADILVFTIPDEKIQAGQVITALRQLGFISAQLG
jgi:hypothetical protein